MTRNVQLMRVWYRTDKSDEGSGEDYVGALSQPFPEPGANRQIVAVDWSMPGEVEVTYLIPEIGRGG